MIKKPLILAGILLVTAVLLVLLFLFPSTPPFQRSAQPLFQALGVAPLGVNNLISRVVALDEMDEAAWSELYRCQRTSSDFPERESYLNFLGSELAKSRGTKGLEYQVFILDEAVPNAFALPGGTILFTRGLYDLLETEAEIAAILLHEMAHVELGHCLNLLRMEILARKNRYLSSLETLEWLVSLFTRPSYQKTEEAEADAWAFQALVQEGYHPGAMSRVFSRLMETQGQDTFGSTSVLEDYFTSHPDLQLRRDKYQAQADLAPLGEARWGEKPVY